MKIDSKILDFNNFSKEMQDLKEKMHFDYLVTIIGEDFGVEGLGCI